MKLFMRLGSPSFVLSRFPKVWKHYFSSGTLAVTERKDTSGTVLIEDAEAFGDAAFDGATGWMKAALQFSGAQDVLIVRTKLSPSASKYQLRWR